MIHYIYKIIFLKGSPENRYYYGKRTYRGKDINNDKYHGSGTFCKEYFKKYGSVLNDTYIKEIIEINETVEDNRIREEVIIGDLWKTDPLCMNRCPGGGDLPDNTKPVLQYDKYGNFVKEYVSIADASEQVGLKSLDCICSVCSRKRQLAANYIWRYKDEPLTNEEYLNLQLRHSAVNQYTKDGKFIKTWDSVKAAADALQIDPSSITDVCKHRSRTRHTAGGFVWSFINESFINLNLDNAPNGRKIDQYSSDGILLKTHRSLYDAGVYVNTAWQNIQCCCNGKTKTAKGYIWKYNGDPITQEELNYLKDKNKSIVQLDDFGNRVSIFKNAKLAAEATGFLQNGINKAIKSGTRYKGFYWRRENVK